VLIVEADMHYRSLNRLLDQHPAHGIYAALSGKAPLDKVIIPTRFTNIYFMDAEPNIPSPSDILSTKRCASLVEKLSEMFDYVIFDTPPVSLFVDAAILSSITDGTLFVARQNQTKRVLAAKCVQQLRVANARILGLVTTFCEGDDSLYYYAYYTQDGKRAEKSTLKHSSSNGGGGSSRPAEHSALAKPVVTDPGRITRSASAPTPAEPDASVARETAPEPDVNVSVAAFASEPKPTTPARLGMSAESDISAEQDPSVAVGTGTFSRSTASTSAYAPNAYRELSARSQRTSRQQRRR
jgi:capsular exopolysaccharide synthesis family protein